ncbi:EAL domain-containing protein [Methylobacter sp. YRD-M1]|uniref:EAL domain-containing protein n=1 Tax=Methylobacter sp. YRD-M1 TaxID=2911520 RepID=UPI00227A186A|nr:EAL domain-containing protein [Methylobacter sp. YRD-M1]WAK03493.1 EAL domain-containing protein [Methylobacter sp. YRD-M1]
MIAKDSTVYASADAISLPGKKEPARGEIESCRILLVEDEPSDAHLIRSILCMARSVKFNITWVTTLAEARAQLHDSPPHDVLLLDLSLPDSNGLDTVHAGRQAADLLPLIVLTGHDDTDFALQTLTLGAQDYLVKGRFDADSLVRAIRYAISRRRLEQRLAETGMHLRTLINALPDIVCFKDGEGRWLEANDFTLQLFQLGNAHYRGRKSSELALYQACYREAFTACEASDEAVWQARGLRHSEETIPRPDGSALIFDITKVPLFHEDGRRKGLVVFGRDITARKQIEARQRLAVRVFETTGEAIMVTDADANIVAVNPAFTRITGYTEQEIVGKNPHILASGRHDTFFYQSMWQSLHQSGEWVGEIWNKRKNGQIFPEWVTLSVVKDEAGSVTNYTAVFADLSEIRYAQETVELLAWNDALTGLANRALFLKQLEQLLAHVRREGGFAEVLLINIDRFKNINEARGFAVGDALLKKVAERLSRMLKPGQLLARLDSDEFAILLPEFSACLEAAGREALALSETLRAVLQESIELEGEAVHFDVSIGIALLPEPLQETATDVLRQADMAMAKAKAKGGGNTVFFETVMGEGIKERFRLEGELRSAISSNQLRLYLQPQVNAAGRQVGAEALVRWQHPKRGLIPPDQFIPLAEASGLITALDRWVLAAVCRLLANLENEGAALSISVNISPRHFRQADFVENIKHLLAGNGVNPAHLILEVTEGLMIADMSDVVAKMTELTGLGVHFSMDDFGTGYSSLAYLKRLPIHELKIDKSFIQDAPVDANDAALVEVILSVAQHLQLRVVAEGVETQVQADFLNARGPIIHQGYLYGKPEPVESWHARLNSAETA